MRTLLVAIGILWERHLSKVLCRWRGAKLSGSVLRRPTHLFFPQLLSFLYKLFPIIPPFVNLVPATTFLRALCNLMIFAFCYYEILKVRA